MTTASLHMTTLRYAELNEMNCLITYVECVLCHAQERRKQASVTCVNLCLPTWMWVIRANWIFFFFFWHQFNHCDVSPSVGTCSSIKTLKGPSEHCLPPPGPSWFTKDNADQEE